MQYYYTKHIRKRIRQRELTEWEIEETIAKPDYTEDSNNNRYLAYKKFRDKLLVVVCRKELETIVLITAYWLGEE